MNRLDIIKQLRNESGLNLKEIVKALDAVGEDIEKARVWLRTNVKAKFDNSVGTSEGCIGSYTHHNLRVGALVHLACQTDFTAKSPEFMELADDIALHIVSNKPQWVSREDVSAEYLESERQILTQQTLNEGRPQHLLPNIVEGRINALLREQVLLEQPFVKNDQVTIKQLLDQLAAKTGEAIKIKSFARQEVG